MLACDAGGFSSWRPPQQRILAFLGMAAWFQGRNHGLPSVYCNNKNENEKQEKVRVKMVEKAKAVAIRHLRHVVRLGQTPQTREQNNNSYSSQIPARASIEQIWQGPQMIIAIIGRGGPLQIRLHATVVDDAEMKTQTAARDAVTSTEAPAEIAQEDGHRAVHPAGEATEGIEIIAIESAGAQMMITGRGDTHPPKTAPTDAAVTEMCMMIETSLPEDDGVYRDLVPGLNARAALLQGRWNDPNVPFLPKTKCSHRRKSQGRGNRLGRQLRSRSPTLPTQDA